MAEIASNQEPVRLACSGAYLWLVVGLPFSTAIFSHPPFLVLIVDHLLPLDSVTNCPMEPVLYYLGLLLDKNMAVIPCNNSDRTDVQCLEDRGGGAENEAT